MLVRLLRYRESASIADGRALFEAEFADREGRYDPELSVYEASLEDVPRLALEQAAAAGADPPRRAIGVDVEPIRSDAVADPASPLFAFSRDQHRILRFSSEDEQVAFADQLVTAMRDGRAGLCSKEKSDLRCWLAARLACNDMEWRAFIDRAPENWRKYPK